MGFVKEKIFFTKFEGEKKMRRTKKWSRVVRSFLCAIVISALLIGTSGFDALRVEAAGGNNIEETMIPSMNENTGVEELEASVIEDMEWSSEIVPYTMLVRCTISVSGDSKGMHIDISTGSVGTASVIGVKDIKIQKKTWYGGWDTVATSSGGESKNLSMMGVTILYENAVKDATYRILCTHYADVDGYTEGDNDSGSFVFTY